VRVAFVQVGRVSSATTDTSTITSISCAQDVATNTPLCENTKTGVYNGMKKFLDEGYIIKNKFDYKKFNENINENLNKIL
jgi:hypothetical protein